MKILKIFSSNFNFGNKSNFSLSEFTDKLPPLLIFIYGHSFSSKPFFPLSIRNLNSSNSFLQFSDQTIFLLQFYKPGPNGEFDIRLVKNSPAFSIIRGELDYSV